MTTFHKLHPLEPSKERVIPSASRWSSGSFTISQK